MTAREAKAGADTCTLALGVETTAQSDSHRRQPYQGDHRTGHRPERNTGHDASAQGAQALEREDDPCHCDQQARADE